MKLSEQLQEDLDRVKAIEDSLKYIDSYLENVEELVSDGGENFSSYGLKRDIKKFLNELG